MPGTIETNTALESGNRMGAVSKAGAIGPEQFMPETAKWLGLKDPNDIASSVDAAGRYWKMLVAKAMKLYPKGNMFQWEAMARGEYDMGPNAFADAIRGNRMLPHETRETIGRFSVRESAYLGQIARNTARPMKVHITTTTPTAARVAVQANAAQ